MNKQDTREQLEADVANILRNAASHTSANTSIGDMLRYTVPGSGAAPWQLEEDACEALASIAERQIAELTAERDKWKAKAEYQQEILDCDCRDTREQLEADASELVADYAASGEVCDPMYNGIIELLDRQAKISERELCGRCSPYATAKDYLGTIDELTAERDKLQERLERANKSLSTMGILRLNEQIDELTAECDKLQEHKRRATMKVMRLEQEREQLDRRMAELAGKYQERLQQIAKLTAEHDELQKVVRIQAESFRKLEVELAKMKEKANAEQAG